MSDAERQVRSALDSALLAFRRGNLRSMDRAIDTLCAEPAHTGRDTVSSLVRGELSRRLRTAWQGGWQPGDVVGVARRMWSVVLGDIAAAAVVDDAGLDVGLPMHPHWSAQLASMEPWWSSRLRPTHQWLAGVSVELALARREVIERCVELIDRLSQLPRLPLLIPAPGPGAALAAKGGSYGTGALDEKVLVKVRALLAKAESTEFAEEAESLTAKAQQFMTRHSIDAAMVDAQATSHDAPAARRIHLESPYVEAKAALLNAVAGPNRCRAVLQRDLGFVTVFGFQGDLQVVDVLFTSLLSQATAAMVAAGRVLNRSGASTRSFRQSFLVAYAHRIGERLQQAAQQSVDEAGGVHGQAMLPVLAGREEAVEAAVGSAFPRMVRRAPRVHDHAGWQAGTIAADQARLGPWNAVPAARR